MNGKLHFAKILVIVMAIAFVSFIFGFIAFNLYVMPMVVEQGKVVIVPNLRGLGQEDVQPSLDSLSLKLKVAGQYPDSLIGKGLILNQRPQAGEQIKSGRTIDVWLSSGQQAIGEVALTGNSTREAEYMLNEKHLQIQERIYTYSGTAKAEMVIGTDPSSDESLYRGQDVDLLISKGARTQTYLMPDLIGRQHEDVRRLLQQFGLKVSEPRVTPDPQTMVGQIITQEPQPGCQIKRGDTVLLSISGG